MADQREALAPVPSTRAGYETEGYLLVRGALAPEEVRRAAAAVDHLVDVISEGGMVGPQFREADHTVRVRDMIGHMPELGFLLDHPRVFGALVDVMGPYLALLASEAFLRGGGDTPLIRFHTDGGPGMQHIGVDPAGWALSAKVQYFLTDVSKPDSGNFMLVAGSHLRRPCSYDPHCWVEEANRHLEAGEQPPGAVQVLARAGDAVIFPHSLWHAVAPNRSGLTRKSVILRFGQLWQRPFDHLTYPPHVLDALTPRQRRLVGDLGPAARPKDYYKPLDQHGILGLEGRHG